MTKEDLSYYIDLLEELDSGIEVSNWEAKFLDSLLNKAYSEGFSLSDKQKAIIDVMKEKYLA